MKLLRGGPVTSPAEPPTITELLAGRRHDGRGLATHRCNAYREAHGLPWLGSGLGKRLKDHLTAAGCDCCASMPCLSWIDSMTPAMALHSDAVADALVTQSTIHGWPITCPVALKTALVDCCHEHARATGCCLEKPEMPRRKRSQQKTTA